MDKLDAYVGEDELVGMIGPNGAGKTTVFNIVTGVYDPTEGDVKFAGTSVVQFKPYQVAELGISRTFQNIRLFSSLSVRDNIRVSFVKSLKAGFFDSVLQFGRFRNEEREFDNKIDELLEIFGLTAELQDGTGSRSLICWQKIFFYINLLNRRVSLKPAGC